jgi:triosephosphate isomerase
MAETAPRALVAGNWKMNGTSDGLTEVRLLTAMLKDVRLRCDVMICPPATLLRRAHGVIKSAAILSGGQDCHWAEAGAHTGDISADMLKDAGASAVIVGHSERRTNHGEDDATVAKKAHAAHRAGLTAIICIGETLEQRKSGQTLAVLSKQLSGSIPAGANAANTVIAYEPVWAIGSGLTPTIEEVAEAHAHIRAETKRLGTDLRLLYGGSVKPANAEALMGVANVNGALVGGASLKAADFIGIIKAYI